MNEARLIEDLLLYQLSPVKVEGIQNVLTEYFYIMFTGVFTLALLFSFFLDLNFEGVIKRAFHGLVAITLFGPLFIGAKDIGMMVGNKIVNAEDNFIFKSWDEALSLSKSGFKNTKEQFKKDLSGGNEKSFWSLFHNIGSDAIGFLIWILSHVALIFTKISFTVAFNLILISIPIVALVNIFPMSSRALDGSLVSIMWIAVTPIVFAIMVELLDGIVSEHVQIMTFGFVAKAILGIIFSLFLISTLSISLKIVTSGTIGEAIGGISQSLGTGVATAGLNSIKSRVMQKGSFIVSKGVKNTLIGSPVKSSLALRGATKLNEFRHKIHLEAERIEDSKPRAASQILNSKTPKTSFKEQLVLRAATIARPLESIRMKQDKREIAKTFINEGKPNQKINNDLVRDYKDHKERPVKKVVNKKVVSTIRERSTPERYYYDQEGEIKELRRNTLKSNNKNEGPRIFEVKKRDVYKSSELSEKFKILKENKKSTNHRDRLRKIIKKKRVKNEQS